MPLWLWSASRSACRQVDVMPPPPRAKCVKDSRTASSWLRSMVSVWSSSSSSSVRSRDLNLEWWISFAVSVRKLLQHVRSQATSQYMVNKGLHNDHARWSLIHAAVRPSIVLPVRLRHCLFPQAKLSQRNRATLCSIVCPMLCMDII